MNDVQVKNVMLMSEQHEHTQEVAATKFGEGGRRGVQDKLGSLLD